MTNYLDNTILNNPGIHATMIVVMIVGLGITLAFLTYKPSVKIILGFISLTVIYLYSWDVVNGVYAAGGFILLAGLIVSVFGKKGIVKKS